MNAVSIDVYVLWLGDPVKLFSNSNDENKVSFNLHTCLQVVLTTALEKVSVEPPA